MSSSTRSPDRGRILVVDDDRLVLATLSFGLARAGFEVIDADNGDDAILLAREHRPGLVLLDIRMEGLSGFDVADYLREHLQIPFVFLSAFSDEETLARVEQLGAVAYLTKPLDIARILPTVEAAFASGRGPDTPPPPVLQQYLPIAMGLLMARDGLSREAALAVLEANAAQEDVPIAEAARRIVESAEPPEPFSPA